MWVKKPEWWEGENSGPGSFSLSFEGSLIVVAVLCLIAKALLALAFLMYLQTMGSM